ncbi:MAG: response regulator transcription factor [Methylococcaceae bacterium]|nr:response regulator transcription factor [Methylococcaceae bacterium]
MVDDHEGIRDVIRQVLADMHHQVFAECGDGHQALELIRSHKPDLVVLDLALPELDGLEVARQARRDGFTGRFLVLTAQMQPHVLRRLHELRIEGVISKLAGIRVWREGLQAVLSGKPYRCDHISQAMTAILTNPDCPSRILSDREIEILGHIGHALSNQEIGHRLHISPHTVQATRIKLLHKLNLPDTPNLVKFAQEQGYAAFPLSTRSVRNSPAPPDGPARHE